MKNFLRLFVAAPLPDFMINELETYLGPYDQPGVRLVPPENWHLTLHFIGNVAPDRLPEISGKLQQLALTVEPFSLKFLRVAPGPNKNAPRLIWAQFAENKTFEKLSRAITLGLGEKIQNQHPIPHVTLARFAKDLRPPKMPPTPARQNTGFEVTEISLWQSELRQPHPRYSVLERYPFGSQNPA
jgi:2'-5' RNA ligase